MNCPGIVMQMAPCCNEYQVVSPSDMQSLPLDKNRKAEIQYLNQSEPRGSVLYGAQTEQRLASLQTGVDTSFRSISFKHFPMIKKKILSMKKNSLLKR